MVIITYDLGGGADAPGVPSSHYYLGGGADVPSSHYYLGGGVDGTNKHIIYEYNIIDIIMLY